MGEADSDQWMPRYLNTIGYLREPLRVPFGCDRCLFLPRELFGPISLGPMGRGEQNNKIISLGALWLGVAFSSFRPFTLVNGASMHVPGLVVRGWVS